VDWDRHCETGCAPGGHRVCDPGAWVCLPVLVCVRGCVVSQLLNSCYTIVNEIVALLRMLH